MKLGDRVELYNGSGSWGYADGVVTTVKPGYVTVAFIGRDDGEHWEQIWTDEQWKGLESQGYLSVKGDGG